MRIQSTARLTNPQLSFLSKFLLAVLVGSLAIQSSQSEMLSVGAAAGSAGQGPPFNINGDGTNSGAGFSAPAGLAVDSVGAVYIADGHAIRRANSSGTNWIVTTLVGDVWQHGLDDGTNTAARFNFPQGVALDGLGNLYVADTYNDTIRKVSSSGTNWIVTTIAGTAGSTGSTNGTNATIRFDHPYGVAADQTGNLFVADTYNSILRKLTPVGTNWVSSTITGLAKNTGVDDGTNSTARFNAPSSLVVEGSTNLYVADFNNDTIRSVNLAGTNWVVTTIAGVAGLPGFADGTNSATRFYQPQGICLDGFGNLIVTDSGNSVIRKLRRFGTNWVVTTVAGTPGISGASNGNGAAALFNQPFGIGTDAPGRIFIADSLNNLLRVGSTALAVDLRLSGTQAMVSWPIASTNYVLEMNTAPTASSSWIRISNGIGLAGDLYSFQTNTAGGRAFFRLHKP